MKLRWLRRLLWLVLILFVAALIWWGGPELRIGDSRPLDPPAARLLLMAVLPLWLLLPVAGAVLAWSWRQRGRLPPVVAVDGPQAACADLLAHLRRGAPRAAGWRAGARRLARHHLPGFAPDVLIVAGPGQAQALQRLWPWDVDGAIGHPQAGDAFWSGGRCWLVLPPQALPAWGEVLRRRRAPRVVCWVVDAGSEAPDRVADASPLDEARVQLGRLRRRTGRQPPLWLLLWDTGPAGQVPIWERGMEALPRGFVLPARAPLDPRAWRPLETRLLRLLRAAVRAPGLEATAARARLDLLHACADRLAAAPAMLRRMSGGDGAFAAARPRAVFWCWCAEHVCIGLEGLLRAASADRPPLRRTADRALARGLVLSGAIVGVLALALQLSWWRAGDHALALARWRAGLPEVALRAEAAARADAPRRGPTALELLDALEGLQATARHETAEALPDAAAARLRDLETRLWRERLRPGLLAWERACLDARKPVPPADLYDGLVAALMLQGRLAAEETVLRDVLLPCGATVEQADAAVRQLRRLGGPAGPADIAPGDDPVAAWRVRLRGDARWTLEERVWHGIATRSGPADARDFDLGQALGPAATWFRPGAAVPWLHTAEGLRLGYRPALDRHAAWAAEYAAVMDEPPPRSRVELEALADRLRVRYVQETTSAWERLFAGTTLAPVRDLAEAAERAQVFGGDTSPFIQLLDVLEQHMPLPPRRDPGLWSRLRQRAARDGARLQYELGWRGSPRPPAPTGDPAFSMAQHFGLLRGYFPDLQGRSPARDGLLQTIQGVGRFLIQKQVAEESGGRAPPGASLGLLRVQAQRLPSPLRQLVTDLAVSSGRQVQQAQSDRLALDLDAIGAWRACRLDPPFPLQPDAASELGWEDFAEDFAPQGRVARAIEASGELIDGSTRPWRPRSSTPGEASVRATAQVRWLERAARLTRAWFPGPAGGLQLTLRPVFLGGRLLEVRLLVGGQSWSYAHGAVVETPLRWPGVAGGRDIEIEFLRVDGERIHRRYTGPWALLRLARDARVEATASPARLVLGFDGGGRAPGAPGAGHRGTGDEGDDGDALRLEVTSNGDANPLDPLLYQGLCAPPAPPRRPARGRPAAALTAAPGLRPSPAPHAA